MPQVKRECAECGKHFMVYASYIGRGPGHGRYCSRTCSNQGAHHPHWKGGRTTKATGYVFVAAPGHPRAKGGNNYVFEHIVIAEKALGHYLPSRAEIHHFDENRANNSPANLVICEDCAYHKLLHKRMRVIAAGGDPNTDKICSHCQLVQPITEFYPSKLTRDHLATMCKNCSRQYARRTRRV